MGGRIRACWDRFRKPSPRLAAGTLLLIGALIVALGWSGFGGFLAYSNTLEFCTSCHEMQAFVYQEYRQSNHFSNRAGVRAICADCHVPRTFFPKLLRKFEATYIELPRHLLGTIDTREKFEAKRLTLARRVWGVMRDNDSRECRNCHSHEAMALEAQKPRAKGQHEEALTSGETCIDCHKGIAHKKPEEPEAPAAEGEAEDDFNL